MCPSTKGWFWNLLIFVLHGSHQFCSTLAWISQVCLPSVSSANTAQRCPNPKLQGTHASFYKAMIPHSRTHPTTPDILRIWRQREQRLWPHKLPLKQRLWLHNLPFISFLKRKRMHHTVNSTLQLAFMRMYSYTRRRAFFMMLRPVLTLISINWGRAA